MARKKDIEHLTCPCCAGEAVGRQHWNQDKGYGLCDNCIERCQSGLTVEHFELCYGEEGYNFHIPGEDPKDWVPIF